MDICSHLEFIPELYSCELYTFVSADVDVCVR